MFHSCVLLFVSFALFHKLTLGTTANTTPDSVVFRNRTRLHFDHELSQDTDETWKQWDSYPTLGIKHPGKPTHFVELAQHEAYKEWVPTRRSTPTTCVVSMYSANLLRVGEWGRYAAENNLNWALSHGYKFSIFRNRLVNETLSFGWSLPRSAMFMLEQGERECAYVFSLDGDAVINNHKHAIASLIAEYLHPEYGSKILMACHWHYGRQGRCQNCECNTRTSLTAVNCSEENVLIEFQGNTHCGVNIGVYLLQNSAHTLKMMRWWAGAGEGNCDWQGDDKFERKHNLAEQKCAVRMKARWPTSVEVVHAGVLNMPSWFDKRRKQFKLQVGDTRAPMDACFSTRVFICHTLGLRVPHLRKKIFERHLRRRRAKLSAWSKQRNESYVSLVSLPDNDKLWW